MESTSAREEPHVTLILTNSLANTLPFSVRQAQENLERSQRFYILILEHGTAQKYSRWNPQIVILDPQNQYASAFQSAARLSTDEATLALPYWLLNLQETIGLLIGKTEFVATSQSNIIKNALLEARRAGSAQIQFDQTNLTVDSPVPYSLDAFENGHQRGNVSGNDKKAHEPYQSVLNKLDSLKRDGRMRFLMSPWDGNGDPFEKVIAQFIGTGKSIRIIDLSGIPNEVAGIASAVIARSLFNFKVWQTIEERERSPVVLVCEEAHRYVPNSGEVQYEAAQEAIRRIAKEGRKYGLGLILVSQRPSEVEATVLSQCNSWIVLRLTNETDRSHVRAILPDSLTGLTKLLSGLRRREAVFVGQAATLPSRILITSLGKEKLPRSHDIDFDAGWKSQALSGLDIQKVGTRWRNQDRNEAKAKPT